MINYVSVNFNTTKHVKAFLLNNFGEKPMFDCKNSFHDFLLLSLNHSLYQHLERSVDYPESINLLISKEDYLRYGCYLNRKQNKFLHLHIDSVIKKMAVCYIDTFLYFHENKKLYKGIDYALKELKITSEDWDIDSIKRYYHRHRTRTGKKLLYNKIEKPLGNLSDLETMRINKEKQENEMYKFGLFAQ